MTTRHLIMCLIWHGIKGWLMYERERKKRGVRKKVTLAADNHRDCHFASILHVTPQN